MAEKSIKEINMRLRNIEYNVIDNDVQDSILEIVFGDSYEIKQFTEDRFQITITRKVTLKPETLLELHVTSDIMYIVEDEENEESFEYTEEYIIDNIADFINKSGALSYVSSIIQNITGSFGRTPFITPNVFKGHQDSN